MHYVGTAGWQVKECKSKAKGRFEGTSWSCGWSKKGQQKGHTLRNALLHEGRPQQGAPMRGACGCNCARADARNTATPILNFTEGPADETCVGVVAELSRCGVAASLFARLAIRCASPSSAAPLRPPGERSSSPICKSCCALAAEPAAATPPDTAIAAPFNAMLMSRLQCCGRPVGASPAGLLPGGGGASDNFATLPREPPLARRCTSCPCRASLQDVLL